MKLLNLGCGNYFHPSWTNIDFVSHSEHVIAFNLRNRIPFENCSYDVVYHSHILEHFSKNEAKQFISECYRVLKPGGIIRIAVPDLETIVREYLSNLQKAFDGDVTAGNNYDWIMLEFFDQMVRNQSGGQMAEYLYQENIPNLDYVYTRIGSEGRNLRENYFKSREVHEKLNLKTQKGFGIRKFLSIAKRIVKNRLLRNELKQLENNLEAMKIGEFRLSGEIHQWLYDRYSLKTLLEGAGFNSFKIKSAYESEIVDWTTYHLDVLPDNSVRKPDSIFIEAIK